MTHPPLVLGEGVEVRRGLVEFEPGGQRISFLKIWGWGLPPGYVWEELRVEGHQQLFRSNEGNGRPCGEETRGAELLNNSTPEEVVKGLKQREKKLHEEKDELLAHMRFPKEHWKQLRAINFVERLNRDIKQRFNVVGVFPNRDAIVRLGGSYLRQQHDPRIRGKRYFNGESMMELMENYSETKSKVVKMNWFIGTRFLHHGLILDHLTTGIAAL